jgi:hypothetical protein
MANTAIPALCGLPVSSSGLAGGSTDENNGKLNLLMTRMNPLRRQEFIG